MLRWRNPGHTSQPSVSWSRPASRPGARRNRGSPSLPPVRPLGSPSPLFWNATPWTSAWACIVQSSGRPVGLREDVEPRHVDWAALFQDAGQIHRITQPPHPLEDLLAVLLVAFQAFCLPLGHCPRFFSPSPPSPLGFGSVPVRTLPLGLVRLWGRRCCWHSEGYVGKAFWPLQLLRDHWIFPPRGVWRRSCSLHKSHSLWKIRWHDWPPTHWPRSLGYQPLLRARSSTSSSPSWEWSTPLVGQGFQDSFLLITLPVPILVVGEQFSGRLKLGPRVLIPHGSYLTPRSPWGMAWNCHWADRWSCAIHTQNVWTFLTAPDHWCQFVWVAPCLNQGSHLHTGSPSTSSCNAWCPP